MKRTSLGKKSRWLCLAALVSVAGCFQASTVSAQSSLEGAAEQPLPLEQCARINYDAYILGSGVATRTQLNQLGQTLALQVTPLAEWVFLDPALCV